MWRSLWPDRMLTVQNADNNYTGKYFIYFDYWGKEHGPRARLEVRIRVGFRVRFWVQVRVMIKQSL